MLRIRDKINPTRWNFKLNSVFVSRFTLITLHLYCLCFSFCCPAEFSLTVYCRIMPATHTLTHTHIERERVVYKFIVVCRSAFIVSCLSRIYINCIYRSVVYDYDYYRYSDGALHASRKSQVASLFHAPWQRLSHRDQDRDRDRDGARPWQRLRLSHETRQRQRRRRTHKWPISATVGYILCCQQRQRQQSRPKLEAPVAV